MLEIIKGEERKPFRYSRMIKPLSNNIKGIYHTHIFSIMKGVKVSLHIKDKDSESVVSIHGGRGLVEIWNSDISIYTEEPVTVQSNGSDSKEEHQKK